LLLADVHAQPRVALERSGLIDRIGEAQIFGSLDEALEFARVHLGLPTGRAPAP